MASNWIRMGEGNIALSSGSNANYTEQNQHQPIPGVPCSQKHWWKGTDLQLISSLACRNLPGPIKSRAQPNGAAPGGMWMQATGFDVQHGTE